MFASLTVKAPPVSSGSFDVQRSQALHRRVRHFIYEHVSHGEASETFDAIAVDIAKHQHASRTGIERLFESRNVDVQVIEHAAQIPAIPTDVFKLRRVACHPPDLDKVVFLTSGTTVGARGAHALRDAETYRMGARAWAARMLHPDAESLHWVVLAPPYSENPVSSLGFMLDDLVNVTGRSVTWAVQDGKLDTDRIGMAVDAAMATGKPIMVAGASFAFVHLLDALGGRCFSLGPRGRAMQTGGFKGKSRSVDGDALRGEIAFALGIDENRIVSEYGMTELGSQAYEGRLRKALGSDGPEDAFVAPPWMRVVAVREDSFEQVGEGQVGIARIEDLANVDSAVVIQTADRIRKCDGGFSLLGRSQNTTPRGCSIGIDEILQAREFSAGSNSMSFAQLAQP